jgi:hypothetical protein
VDRMLEKPRWETDACADECCLFLGWYGPFDLYWCIELQVAVVYYDREHKRPGRMESQLAFRKAREIAAQCFEVRG